MYEIKAKSQKFYFLYNYIFVQVREVMLMYTLNALWKKIKVRWVGPKFNALWNVFPSAKFFRRMLSQRIDTFWEWFMISTVANSAPSKVGGIRNNLYFYWRCTYFPNKDNAFGSVLMTILFHNMNWIVKKMAYNENMISFIWRTN